MLLLLVAMLTANADVTPATVCLMVIACPSVSPAPTPTPGPVTFDETAQIATWNAMTDAERVTFWNGLTMPEQKAYYWNVLQTAKRGGLCVALGLPATCNPVP
jgi:hypothetical protein